MKKGLCLAFIGVIVISGLALLGVTFLAQTGQAGQQEQQVPKELQVRPKHEVTVAVKLVQVYVTDKGGNPAGDLTADDFEIYDNNKPVPVLHFEKHFAEELAAAGTEGPRPALNRKFFLFFDLAFTDARGLMRAKNAALKFMEKSLLPTDEISLVTYTALRGLTLHEYMTRDHARVRNIIENFGLKSVTGRAENLANFFYSDTLMTLQGDEVETTPEDSFFTDQARLQTGQMLDTARRQGYVDQARFYLDAWNNLAKVLRTVPGYKNIVLFSAGLAKQLLFGKTGGAVVGDWSTPEQLAAQMAEYDAAQADTGLRSDFSRLLKELKNSNCAVFTVDISRVHKEMDVEGAGGAMPGARELDGADSLKQLASETGGRFYANTVNPENAMEEIVNTTKNFYILGFKVDESWDGKYHKVKVKVKKKGYNVYSQAGYFNPKPFREYNNFERLLHLIEVALTEEPWPYVPVEIPVASLNLVEKGWPMALTFARASAEELGEVFGAKTEAYLLIFNEKGELALIKKFRAVVSEKDKKENDAFLPSFLLPIKPGKYECALVMRNLDTGRAARGRAAVEVPGQLPVMPYLDPPLLLRLDDRAKEISAGGEPTLASIYGYNPGTYSAVAGRVPPETRKLYAALRLACPAGWEEGLAVGVELTGEGGEPGRSLPVAVLEKKREGQLLKVLLELETGELGAGEYAVTFTVGGPNFAQPLRATTRFSL
ncbi:MAG: VWA domain-containing protein [Candidatus Saccharicenans sp.]|jgi:VWFA-related protein|nr:VWA domain-containing protein [Candidatus Saccharicenans sp.]MDH7574222.1 VWA domain-containing protein [Candidatus Saccharicenans sp.]